MVMCMFQRAEVPHNKVQGVKILYCWQVEKSLFSSGVVYGVVIFAKKIVTKVSNSSDIL